MSERPFISVVMPVYNAEMYIDRAVGSVLSQTCTDIELILVDDCSADRSSEKCDAWAKRDQRVRAFHLPENGGAGRARNYGIEKAEGIYLTFLDADDRIDPDLYERVSGIVKEKPYDVVVWGLTEQYYNEKDEKAGENRLFLEDAFYENAEEVRKAVIDLEDKTLFGYQWNHLYKRQIIMDHNIRFRPVHLYEDYFFNLAYIEYAGSMAVSSCTGYYYNKRMNQSLTKQFVPEYFKLSRKRVTSMADAYRRWGLYNEKIRDSVGQRYLRYTLSALMRNNEKEAQMGHAARRQWIRRLFRDEFYQETVRDCVPGAGYLKILQKMIDLRSAAGCLLMGKMLYILRHRLPQVYNKKGQIH